MGGGCSFEVYFVVILILELIKCEFFMSGFRIYVLGLIRVFRKSVILFEVNYKEINFL